MVPSVAGLVMRRCRQTAIGTADAPVGLPFQIRAMAGGTVIHIVCAPRRDHARVVGIDIKTCGRLGGLAQIITDPEGADGEHDGNADGYWSNVHGLKELKNYAGTFIAGGASGHDRLLHFFGFPLSAARRWYHQYNLSREEKSRERLRR